MIIRAIEVGVEISVGLRIDVGDGKGFDLVISERLGLKLECTFDNIPTQEPKESYQNGITIFLGIIFFLLL